MPAHALPLPAVPRPARTQSLTREPRYPWSEQELSTLQQLSDQGLTDDEIARRLGRTPRAVRTMILRVGGKRLREPSRPWSDQELETAIRLHASGAMCAAIADVLPGRTPVAVFRKLCRLVGPAPSAIAKRSRRPKKRPADMAKAAAAPIPIRIRTPPPAPTPPSEPIPATTDAMVRWLRSRDFMVLHRDEGWRIDHHHLNDDDALVEFVNLRRARLHLPPFVLVESPIMPATIVSQVVRGDVERGRRWGRPHTAVRRA
ncbi:MAG: hypothetical protein WCO00_05715 [Rhodospirillaceae bacterium]